MTIPPITRTQGGPDEARQSPATQVAATGADANTLDTLVFRRFATEKSQLPRLAEAPTMTIEEFQRLLRNRAQQQPGTPVWHEQERQRLDRERLQGDGDRLRERQQRDAVERDLERRRLERR